MDANPKKRNLAAPDAFCLARRSRDGGIWWNYLVAISTMSRAVTVETQLEESG